MVNSLSDKKLLFVRICGTGMSSAALMAQKSGAVVSGVDNAFHPPVSDILERAEIKCFPMENFSGIMETNPPDMLIVGNALSGRSKEADIVRKTSIPVYSMPSFLETFLIGDKKSLVVAGTHGKSTTSTMISEYLFNSGSSPSYFIGALTGFSGTNAELDSGPFFVLEGDEYDTAFFDKRPKFLHYQPFISIITSIEYDHADIYDSVDDIFSRFRELVEITRKRVIICSDCELNRKLVENCDRDKFFTYSMIDRNADLFAEKTGRTEKGLVFSVNVKGKTIENISIPMIGEQNILNCLSLISFLFCEEILPDDNMLREKIGKIKGLKRRQEFLGTVNGGSIYSDFAHHPTAARLTTEGFRDFFREKKINVVFDPATNSNNQNVFEDEYISVFSTVDAFCLGRPPKLHRFPPEKRFRPEQVVKEVEKTTEAAYCEKPEDVINWIKTYSGPDSVTIIMSNSDFSGVFKKLSSILDN